MKSINLSFYENEIIDGTLKIYDSLNNTINLNDIKDEVISITYDNYFPTNLKIKITNSNLTLIETYKGNLQNVETSMEIDEFSKVKRLGLYIESGDKLTLNRNVYNYGFYQNIQLDLTNSDITNTENMELLNQDGSCQTVTALYAEKDNKKIYNTNFIHKVGMTKSDCKIFGVCNDLAHMTIATDAYIKSGARHTKAIQEGRIINLSETCKGIILPELHIDENDVEAAHSCSVGSVNLDHLYYLQTRGFSAKEGEKLLIKSYFTPIYSFIKDEDLKQKLQEAIEQRIG